jgi:hypothetical protein
MTAATARPFRRSYSGTIRVAAVDELEQLAARLEAQR